jgi:hypothetical protein
MFRPFVGGVLDSEMQLAFPKGLRSPEVVTFVRVATRMVRRMPVAYVGWESVSMRAAS